MIGQITVTETASSLVQYNLNRINQVRAYYPEYNGRGTLASIKEFRYDTLDIDFSGRHVPSARASAQNNAHATLMATIIAGGGNSDRTGLGVAWGAQLTSSSFLNLFPDANDYFGTLGISVQNHSYGIDSIENFYGPVAAAYDLQISQLPHLLHVFSIGNLGAVSPQYGPYAGIEGFANMTGEFKVAKNVLTMGVVDSFAMADPFSSRGPAFDGRIKPELVAFGIDGSSGAAALASGSALVLQQAYREIYDRPAPAALIKALLINGATDLGAPGPDYLYGFGSIHLFRTLETLLAGNFITDTLAFDQMTTHSISVPEGVEELKISLVWTDPPAAVNAAKALVNDLDMILVGPAGEPVWQPQILSTFPNRDSLMQAASSGPDHMNNVEQIVVQNPPAGEYEIRLEAFDFQVAEQVYHLVYDWDTTRSFQWVFPSAGDQIIASNNFIEQLYWEPPTGAGQGSLSYSFDGLSWILINASVDLSAGQTSWSPPDTIASVLLRMDTGAQAFISDKFTIATQPALQVVLNCQDSIGISWPRPQGIDQFQIYTLGAQYLEPYQITPDTFFIIPTSDLALPFVAYAPRLPDGQEAIRSRTYRINQNRDCYVQRFTGEISGESALLYLILNTTYGLAALELEKLENGAFSERQSATISTSNRYTFTDTELQPGSNLYRIKMTRQNGTVLYSDMVDLQYIPPDEFLIYPNPLSRNGSFQVLYNVPEPEQVFLQLYTALGAEVLSLNLPTLETAFFADDLQSGVYFYRFVRNGNLLQSGKLVVR